MHRHFKSRYTFINLYHSRFSKIRKYTCVVDSRCKSIALSRSRFSRRGMASYTDVGNRGLRLAKAVDLVRLISLCVLVHVIDTRLVYDVLQSPSLDNKSVSPIDRAGYIFLIVSPADCRPR